MVVLASTHTTFCDWHFATAAHVDEPVVAVDVSSRLREYLGEADVGDFD